MTITTFDRVNMKALRDDLDVALAAVADKHGVAFSIGTLRFSPERVKMTLTGNVVTTNEAKGVKIAGEVTDLDTLAARHDLPANLMGRSITVRGRSFTITGAKPSRPKYPFIVTGSKGGRYKMTATDIRAGLGA